MKMVITATTDRQYLGRVFESKKNPIILAEDFEVFVEKTLLLTNGVRFISSNYIIDAEEVA